MNKEQKQKQLEINDYVESAINEFNTYTRFARLSNWKRLDYCSAYTCQYGKYIILKSYMTIIAFVDTETNEMFDFLRYVYGYTNTSAKHIARFIHYNRYANVYTWREI